MKILSPVGNMQSLKAAVNNGADEVYLGIDNFNARNIQGFTLQTLEEAIDYCHIFGVKVCLAINILFTDNELQDALNTLVQAYNLGVDAFIIQDLGLAYLVHKNYPEIELHASTQMGLHNLEGVQAILPYGFKRVVLARETPLSEIKRIKENTNVEIEYFAHGALCVSFSGNCYLSSYLCSASGNRGKCKQLCRLPYQFFKNDALLAKGYLLSAKDFNMIYRLTDLQEAGVDILKIEGRARRPYYVAVATREYKNALEGKKNSLTDLKLAFNRDYTPGYFDGNNKIISGKNNHVGITVGSVVKVNNGKNFNQVYFTSNRLITEKSVLKFFNNNIETTVTAFDLKQIDANSYMLTTTNKVVKNSVVNLIVDYKNEEETLNKEIKKVVEIEIIAEKNKNIVENISDGVCVVGDVCQEANTRPITKKDLIDNFKKSELFNITLNITKLEDVFLTKQQLNSFRRNVVLQLYNLYTKSYKHNIKQVLITTNLKVRKFEDFEIVSDDKYVGNKSNIILDINNYSVKNVEYLYKFYKNMGKNAFLDTPNFVLEKDIVVLSQIINKFNIPIIANNYYALTLTDNYVVGAGLNVYNSITANLFNKPIITAESNISSKINFAYMTLRHCPLKQHLKADCKNCPYNDNYFYKMDSGKVLKLKRKKFSSCTFYLTD